MGRAHLCGTPGIDINLEYVVDKTRISPSSVSDGGYRLSMRTGGHEGYDLSVSESFGKEIMRGDVLLVVSEGSSTRFLVGPITEKNLFGYDPTVIARARELLGQARDRTAPEMPQQPSPVEGMRQTYAGGPGEWGDGD